MSLQTSGLESMVRIGEERNVDPRPLNGGWFRLPHAVGAQIREHFVGAQQAAAAWLLIAMCEMADAARRDGAAGWVFSASYADIGKRTGMNWRTVRRYMVLFEQLGLVAIERRQAESGRSLPNEFIVVALERTYVPH